jgi:hypothetical protein
MMVNPATVLQFPRRETDSRTIRVNRNIEKLTQSSAGTLSTMATVLVNGRKVKAKSKTRAIGF